ncbi:carcinine hydrolase/isopenicillin-N N-acyltransferase family protein, partial [Klebsiella pneumoniae]
RPDGMPRQIVARASLNAATLEEAVTLLSATPRAGAFHHTLGQMGDSRLFSVEATGSGSSVLELSTTGGHANHLIHPQLAAIEQIVTGSSASRQRRLDAWLATNPPLDGVTAKAMLSDQQ